MVVGGTGVGKTTLINRMVNYIFGVNYTDTFRFQLIDEIESSETESQTSDIHKYTIHLNNFPYKITIIDTPGIMSTKGKKEDKATLEKIRYLFESGKIEAVDAICIIEKYDEKRLTENKKYVFQTIARIFGKDVGEVTFIMSTHCNELTKATPKPPTVLKIFDKEEIAYKKYYLFNNDDIYAKPITDPDQLLEAQVATKYWNNSTTSCRVFFERLEVTTPISLKLTKEILQKKYHIINILLPYLIRTLKVHIHEIEEIEQDRKLTKQLIDNPDTSKFTVNVKVTKRILEDITEPNQFSTRCKTCDVICHYPCDINQNNYILKNTKWCSAMINLQFSIHCTMCEGKCSWKDHEQIKKKAVFKTLEERRTDTSLKERYMKDKKGKMELVKKKCEEKILFAYNMVLKDFKDMQNGIDFINKHSLCKKPTTIKDYVDDVIELEEEAKEDGYKQRVLFLKKLVEMKDELSPSKNVQQAITFITKIQDL